MNGRLSGIEKALALRSAPLFSAVPTESLLPIAVHSREVALEVDEALFRAGDFGDALYVVLSGEVEVVSEDGERLALLGAGECVGEMAALDWEPRSATVHAETSTRLLRVDRTDLLDLLADHPPLVMTLARVLARRIRASGAGAGR